MRRCGQRDRHTLPTAVVADQHMVRQVARDLEGDVAFGQVGGVRQQFIDTRLPGLERNQRADELWQGI